MALNTDWDHWDEGPFKRVWEHPDGWSIVCQLAASGQFDAALTHGRRPGSSYDRWVIEQAHGYQFADLCQQALQRFDAWLSEHGQQALADLPFRLMLKQGQADALLAGMDDLLLAAEGNWELREALLALKAQIEL